MAILSCPTCRQYFDTQLTRAMPFCSERCRRIDLGRWLNEEIALPAGESVEDELDETPPFGPHGLHGE
jgi:endogenous inhibitor of DNA gyrase (YacG/DUF329 family)